ncbi:MAG: L,D-transpeptidase family protein [Bacteroidota bacterium]
MFQKIINSGLLTCIALLFSFFSVKDTFKTSQLKNQRVKTAYQKKWPALQTDLKAKGIDENNYDIYLRAFKQESLLEVFVKNSGSKQFQLLKTIPICAKSGRLGPKRKQGDNQVPEGFYEITAFNPVSSYHLSLKVGYPNKSDLIKSGGDPGGDIMIHGSCVTIGCIPLENEPIEELYVLCVEARNRARSIQTHIFPYRFNENNRPAFEKNYDAETIGFWSTLEKAFNYFELNHSLPKITTDTKGNYQINPV